MLKVILKSDFLKIERNAMNLDSREQNITRKETCDVTNPVNKECELNIK
jgi:hypothetical protein